MNDNEMPTPSLNPLNFTIFLKNIIVFKNFGVLRSNVLIDRSYLKQCIYDPSNHSLCPIFRIGTLLDMVEPKKDEQRLMLQFGGIIHIIIEWFCNLDRSLSQ